MRVAVALLLLPGVTAYTYCLPENERVTLPLLRRAYVEFRKLFRGGSNIRIAYKSWTSAKILSEITRILAVEAIGMANDQIVFSTDRCCTGGSYQDLARGVADIDMELWRTIAPAEAAKYINASSTEQVHDGGQSFYARSGIFLRPGQNASQMLEFNRFYSSLNDTIIPLLPTAGELIDYCGLGSTSDCVAMPNRNCTREPCKALIKSWPSYDGDTVENMIINSSLPLVIFYSGSNTPRILNELPHLTALFYHWEPDWEIPPGTDIMRMNFDDPAACRIDVINSRYPHLHSCDFDAGGIHKAMSARIHQDFDELAYLVNQFEIAPADLLSLLMQSQADASLTPNDLACEWVTKNKLIWKGVDERSGWLKKSASIDGSWRMHLSITIAVLVVSWLLYPFVAKKPSVGSQWTDLVGRSGADHYSHAMNIFFHIVLLPLSVARLLRYVLKCSWKRLRGGARGKRVLVKGLSQENLNHRFTSSSLSKMGMTQRTLVRSMSSAASEATKWAPREFDVAAATIQGIFRGKALAEGMRYRAKAKSRMSEGVQFAQRKVYGVEGSIGFKVGIIRGRSMANDALTIAIEATDSTAVEGVHYVLHTQEATLQPGDRFVPIYIDLPQVGVQLSTGKNESWLPVREFELKLSVKPDKRSSSSCAALLGTANQCTVAVINKDEWPSAGTVEAGHWAIFSTYVMTVVMANFRNEVVWFAGVCYRAIHHEIIVNEIVRSLFDDAIPQTNMQLGVWLGALELFFYLLDHVTDYWFSSSWTLNYDLTLTWVLSRWTSLPLNHALDHEKKAKFKAFINLLREDIFTDNDYTLFVRMTTCAVETLVLFIYSFFVLPDMWYLPPTIYLAVFLFWALLSRSSGRDSHAAMSSKWLDKEKNLVNQIANLFDDGVTHRTFKRANQESSVAIAQMSECRNVEFTKWAMRDAVKQYTDWVMVILRAAFVALSPVLIGLNMLRFGDFLALLSSLSSARGILRSLTEIRQDINVTKILFGKLASILNESRDEILASAATSRTALRGIERAVGQTNMDLHMIELYRLRYTTPGIYDALGYSLELNIDSRLPLYELLGLRAHDPSLSEHATLNVQHRATLDLITGLRIPTDGAVVIPPHLRVQCVPSEPGFIGSATLLQNLRYGCGKKVPEDTVWKLCRVLGLPVFFFSHRGGAPHISRCPPLHLVIDGDMQMAQIAHHLSPTQRQLTSLARSLLCAPDVLLIHELGEICPRDARVIGDILRNFVAGVALTRLGNKPQDVATSHEQTRHKLRRTSVCASQAASVSCGPSAVFASSSDLLRSQASGASVAANGEDQAAGSEDDHNAGNGDDQREPAGGEGIDNMPSIDGANGDSGAGTASKSDVGGSASRVQFEAGSTSKRPSSRDAWVAPAPGSKSSKGHQSKALALMKPKKDLDALMEQRMNLRTVIWHARDRVLVEAGISRAAELDGTRFILRKVEDKTPERVDTSNHDAAESRHHVTTL